MLHWSLCLDWIDAGAGNSRVLITCSKHSSVGLSPSAAVIYLNKPQAMTISYKLLQYYINGIGYIFTEGI